MLRGMKKICESIGDYLVGVESFRAEFIAHADNLTVHLDEYYQLETMLREEMYGFSEAADWELIIEFPIFRTNLLLLIFDKRNVSLQMQAIESLKQKSKNRTAILNQLMLLEVRCLDYHRLW